MAAELSKVLDHIEKIGELDLDGVPPTSHVVDVVNALRADEPEPSLPREVMLAAAPEPLTAASASPARARRMSDLHRPHAAAAAAAESARGEIDPRRAVRGLPGARRVPTS